MTECSFKVCCHGSGGLVVQFHSSWVSDVVLGMFFFPPKDIVVDGLIAVNCVSVRMCLAPYNRLEYHPENTHTLHPGFPE